jgi:hypothetical protein
MSWIRIQNLACKWLITYKIKVLITWFLRIDELDANVDADVDSLHVKRIDIKDLVSYVYIVRVDTYCLPLNFQGTKLVSLDPYRLKTFLCWVGLGFQMVEIWFFNTNFNQSFYSKLWKTQIYI